ncbi:MAG TPA: D-alanyl-D-alanine carboxypeptidase family protein [Candidatus Paceibacterota bacterium]|nr:D-alanyl-D-alanine carboxypeptidase family protein [Candidatus Paceibacterota bacterium]
MAHTEHHHHHHTHHALARLSPEQWALIAIGILLIASIGLGGWYAYAMTERVDALTRQTSDLAGTVASTTAVLQQSIAQTNATLAGQLEETQSHIATVQSQLGSVQGQVGSLDSSVTTLNKLETTDPELLAKYSKVYFLNENYQPARLTELPNQYKYIDDRDVQLVSQIVPDVEKMINDAKAQGVTLYVDSAYRSFASQKNLKDAYSVTYGAGTANSFSAEQGYSEHQLGTAVDFMTTGIGGQLDTDLFKGTAAYQWLLNNAYKYGFELSYPEGNGDYIFEPWHWRFVGIKLATYLHDNNLRFYDLDQRTIDGYLADLFDNLPS